jgi:F-box and leucine-rich repeat protein 1 (S-phase kinase-associated protein 2)
LVELNVAWTTSVSSECLSVFCANLPPTLTRVNLSGGRKPPSTDDQCRQSVDDNDIMNMCGRCPSLQEVDLSDCARVTVVGLTALVSMPSVQILHCNRCYGIEPIHFANECEKIVELNVIGCVTNEGYDVLRNRLQNTQVNASSFSTVARPTVGTRRTSIWTMRTRDD